MIKLKDILTEKYEIDLTVGDTILRGKFKNKPVVVKEFGVDDKGQPTVNGKKMLSFRIKKLIPAKVSVKEAKFGAKDIMKAAKNKSDWGDLADQLYMKGGNMVHIDSWYYGQDKALKQLIDSWKKGGSNYDYWNKEHGVDFKIVDTFSEIKAQGRHKKLTSDGIVGVVLKVIPSKVSVKEGKAMPMDTPNEFAYLDFKKYANIKSSDFTRALEKAKGDGGKMFMTASALWYKWSRQYAKDFTHIKDKKKFGRALLVMLKKDDLIISKKGNKLTDLK